MATPIAAARSKPRCARFWAGRSHLVDWTHGAQTDGQWDNVGIVVDDLAATVDFFRELGLELEGRATIEGEWAGRVTGLDDQCVEIPDGHGRLKPSPFLTPLAVADHRNTPLTLWVTSA